MKHLLLTLLAVSFVACSNGSNNGSEATRTSVTGGDTGDIENPPAPIIEEAYSLGGNVTGLGEGESVVLMNNDGDELTLTSNGPFTFATSLAEKSAFNVTVKKFPANKPCTVENASGTIPAENVVTVSILCEEAGLALWGASVTAAANWSYFYAVSTDAGGNAYAVGDLNENGDFSFAPGISVKGRCSFDENGVIVKYDPSGAVKWAKAIISGGTKSDLLGVKVDVLGNVYGAGMYYSNGTNDFGNGVSIVGGVRKKMNPILVKYDQDGNAKWARGVTTGSGSSYFHSVTTDPSGNIYAIGGVAKDEATMPEIAKTPHDFGNNVTALTIGEQSPVIVKYSPDGVPQWARTVIAADNSAMFYTGSSDAAGNIYAVGFTKGPGTFKFAEGVQVSGGSDDYNLLIVKYDTNGNAKWARSATGGVRSSYYDISTDAAGYSYAVGILRSTAAYDLGGGIIAKNDCDCSSNALLVRYDPNGVPQWARAVSAGGKYSGFHGISSDAKGDAYAVGSFSGVGPFLFGDGASVTGANAAGSNAFIVKYDTKGTAQWARGVTAGSDSSSLNSVTVAPSGDIIATGTLTGNKPYTFKGDLADVTVTGAYAGATASDGYNSNAFIIMFGK